MSHQWTKIGSGENIMAQKKDKATESILVHSIKESIFGPTYFAELYWKHIEEGCNPDDF